MTASFLFWVIAAAGALVSFGALFAPMLRGAAPAESRARYDAKVFRDQLREIEADKTRGLMTEAEARATEIEVSRRLLASAGADGGSSDASGAAPRRASRLAGAGLTVLLLLAGLGLYASLGSPELGDQPLLARLERAAAERADRPGQAEAEAALAAAGARIPLPDDVGSTPPPAPGPRRDAAPEVSAPELSANDPDSILIARLKEAVASRPRDERGQRLLARALGGLGDWAGARAAQGALIGILGERATADDYAEWAELMILATNGYVSPEAEAALGQALTREPGHQLARYYSGITLLQGGRPDLAYRIWSGLLAEGPETAPWIPTIRSQIGEVARMAGLPPPDVPGAPRAAAPRAATPQPPGPSAAEIEAAGEMAAEDRQSMIEGMVGQLAARLDTDGGTAEDWARLIRSQGVLGRVSDAQASWDRAKAQFADDPAALDSLAEAARAAGLSAR